MRQTNGNLELTRFYEITGVDKDDPWSEEPGSIYCVLGAIVQPTGVPGRYIVIRVSATDYLTVTKADENGLYLGCGLTLRPLNKKDQRKIQRVRDQFA